MSLSKFDKDLVPELERLLAKAKAGEMIGIFYAVELEPGQHYFGMTRSYAENPHDVLKVTSRAAYKLNQFISAMAGEPATDMMPL